MTQMGPPRSQELRIPWEQMATLANHYGARRNWVSASKEFHPRGCACPKGAGILFDWVSDFMEEAKNSNTVY